MDLKEVEPTLPKRTKPVFKELYAALNDNGLCYVDGDLTLDGHSLSSLLSEYGSPLILISEPNIARIVKGLDNKMKKLDASLNPRLKPGVESSSYFELARIFSSVSESATLGLIRSLAALNVGLIANSAREVERSLAAGVAPQNIVFSNVLKTSEFFDEALRLNLGAIELICWSDIEALMARPVGTPKLNISLRLCAPWCSSYLGLSAPQFLAAVNLISMRTDINLVGVSSGWDSCLEADQSQYKAHLKEVKEIVDDLQMSGAAIDWVMVGPRSQLGSGNVVNLELRNSEAEYADLTTEVFSGCSFRVYFSCADALLRNSCHAVGKAVRMFNTNECSTGQAYLADLLVGGLLEVQQSHWALPLQSHPGFDVDGMACTEIWTRSLVAPSFVCLGQWDFGGLKAGDGLVYPSSGLRVFESVLHGESAPTEILLMEGPELLVIRSRKRNHSGFDTEI